MGELTAMNDTIMTESRSGRRGHTNHRIAPQGNPKRWLETIFESIIQALQTGDKIEIRGFSTAFAPASAAAGLVAISKTSAKVEVPPKRIPFFKPSKELKDFVNADAAAAAAATIFPQAPSQ